MRLRSARSGSTVLAIGEFDGCHLGHRRLLEVAGEVARRHEGVYDVVVLDRRGASGFVTDVDERMRHALRAGARSSAVLSVELHDNDIVVDTVKREFDPRCVVLACAATLDDVGVGSLTRRFADAGILVVESERVIHRGEPITSERVRHALHCGDVEMVEALTGRTHEFSATVQRGDQLGRTIGFPTANLPAALHQVVPGRGVYAGYAVLPNGTVRDAAINIGTRPTVSSSDEQLVEAHVVGFDGDLYDEALTLGFVRRLRGEHRFEGLDALTAQLERDVAATVRLHPSRVRS